MNKLKFPIALSVLALSNSAFAGGLSLPQIGTAESTGTAGVSNVTNNRDASAVISNAAGLSGIKDSSLMIGIQYLDVNNDFQRENDALPGTNGSSGQFMPHVSYAKRINEQWVVGMALHSPGGLGIGYENGLNGGINPIYKLDSNSLATVNITTSAAFQVNDKLSLGGSVIAQYFDVKSEFDGPLSSEITGNNWAPSFALSGLYQINQQTHVGMTYNFGAQHDVNLEVSSSDLSQEVEFNWPQSVELGVQHNLSAEIALMASANWQQWSKFGEGIGENYDDTYGIGIAMSYQLDSWKLHTGISADTSPLSSDDRGHALPLDDQWRVGVGAEKTLNNGMVFGLAYQYQSLGNGEISGRNISNGSYENNRVHFITGSLSF